MTANPGRLAQCDHPECGAEFRVMRGQDAESTLTGAGWVYTAPVAPEWQATVYCPAHRPNNPADNPDDGHTFRISVTSRMSSTVVGDEHHTDADYFGPPLVLDVRAWNLRDALAHAARVERQHWQHPEEES